MEDLFRSYWWLMFPLAWFIGSGWASWLNYRRQRETLDVVRRYVDKGQEVPPELMKVLDKPIDAEVELWRGDSKSSPDGQVFSTVLFLGLAAGFGYAAWSDFFGAGDAFTIVTIVMSALALASLVSLLTRRRR